MIRYTNKVIKGLVMVLADDHAVALGPDWVREDEAESQPTPKPTPKPRRNSRK